LFWLNHLMATTWKASLELPTLTFPVLRKEMV
jgi:hypothetical protein